MDILSEEEVEIIKETMIDWINTHLYHEIYFDKLRAEEKNKENHNNKWQAP